MHKTSVSNSMVIEPSVCALCNRPASDAPTVPTTSGEVVHVACAERDAARAYRRRTWRSGGSAFLLLVLLVGAKWAGLDMEGLLVLALLLALCHSALNRRWWLHTLPRRRWRARRG